MEHEEAVRRAALAVAAAEGLVIAAGAGMGVDSGLPDFRGRDGFWKAYPLYARLGLGFASMANPRWFSADPAFAWGFYGHRLELYRSTRPHAGFAVLAAWAARMARGAFVFTSNVDGQFQAAGFDDARIAEVHGSIHHAQCFAECTDDLLSAASYRVIVDPETVRAREPLPACPKCGGVARPNILMFGDGGWDPRRSIAQEERLEAWLAGSDPSRLVVVECGAGTAIPTVRYFSERLARRGATLVRINVREPEVPTGQIGLPMGALAALQAIDAAVAGEPA